MESLCFLQISVTHAHHVVLHAVCTFCCLFISREVAGTILYFVVDPDWTLHRVLHSKCDFQEKVFLVWDRYRKNNISTFWQGTEDCCLWCLQKQKAIRFVLFKNSYHPLSSQSLFLWAKSTDVLFSRNFCRIWRFQRFRSITLCVCVGAFVSSACTCPCASGASSLSNGVRGAGSGQRGQREGKCSLQQTSTFKPQLQTAAVQ